MSVPPLNRRHFLGTTVAASALSLLPTHSALAAEHEVTDAILEHAAAQPVLQISQLKDPIIIESIELLRKGRNHFGCQPGSFPNYNVARPNF